MPRTSLTFRQADVTRALKGAKAAGLEVGRVEIGKDGKIVVIISLPQGEVGIDCAQPSKEANPWHE